MLNWSRKKNDYPKENEILDDVKYRPEVVEAVEKFKKSDPGKGSLEERQVKIRTLNNDLAKIYKIEPPQVVFARRFRGGSCYFPVGNIIIMAETKNRRYSVITFLHEFGHALGKNERGTCKWSVNLFRKCFPESFAKLKQHGHLFLS